MNTPTIRPELYLGLARNAATRSDFGQARDYYVKHLEHFRFDYSAIIDHAVCCYRMGNDKPANSLLGMIPFHDPEYVRARAIISLVELGRGEFRFGWLDYDAHYRVTDQRAIDYYHLSFPVWRGEDITGKVLLVRGEQGIGDEIMWCSLLRALRRRFRPSYLLLECNPKIDGLLYRSLVDAGVNQTGVDDVIARDIPPAPRIASNVDYQIPAASLGARMLPNFAHFPGERSWLKPEPRRVYEAAAFLPDDHRLLRVGFCWRSLRFDKDQTNYAPATAWSDLTATPGVHAVNLQAGADTAELSRAFRGDNFTIPESDYRDDIEGLAGPIVNLDLVVGPPNTVTYLAAALGIETWVLSFKREWIRHGAPDNRTPWFPAMRIYEKFYDTPTAGWFAGIAALLRDRVKQKI